MVESPCSDVLQSVGFGLPLDVRRELVDCVVLGRAIRVSVPTGGIQRVPRVSEALGLRYCVSAMSFDWQFDLGMQWWSSSAEVYASGHLGSMRFVYLHQDDAVCSAAEAADRLGDDRAVGELLGYPVCCVEAFVEWCQASGGTDPMISTLQRSAEQEGLAVYAGPSPFSRYFGAGVLSHFPCSLTCDRTIEMGVRSFRAFRCVYLEDAVDLLSFENCPTAFQAGSGVCLWRRFENRVDGLFVDPRSAIGDGPLLERLGCVRRIDDSWAGQHSSLAGVFLGRSTFQGI